MSRIFIGNDMLEVKAPQPYSRSNPELTMFLAGSIEMGKAVDWQTRVATALKDTNYTLLNPRRDSWDSSWIQSISNPKFAEQVNWELDGIEFADTIIFYFDPATQSPITLMELGKVAELVKLHSNKKAFVCVPDGYWRKGNVEVVCARSGITLLNDLEVLIDFLKAFTSI